MKAVSSGFILFFFCLIYCGGIKSSEPGTSATSADPVEFKMNPDTVKIVGKFLNGCYLPDNIKIAIHNVDNSWWKNVPVVNGEFSYNLYLDEPRRVALRTAYNNKIDFFTTTREKVYTVEISCSDPGKEKIEIKGSGENAAYIPFSEANKQHQKDLDSLAKMDVLKKETFSLIRQNITDYQKTLADIAKAHPNTYTAQVLCAMEKLSDNALNSQEELQKTFLNREALALPYFYNDFLPQRILLNCFAIRGKNSNPDEAVNTLMGIALKNREAAKRLQEIMFSLFYKMHQEDLLTAFINWTERHPESLFDMNVKQRLENIGKVIAGKPMIDFTLNDNNGKPQQLSAVVNSSKVTVLIFYGPTCGHCKEKLPQLLPLWDKYKNKGLKIIAVGKDGTTDEWKIFITDHASPEWVHVYQAESGVQPADLYYIDSTPSFIMIDGNGNIISRLADVELILEKVPELLR